MAEPPSISAAKPGTSASVRNELATQARRPGSAVFHLILLGCYLVAGVAVSWPRARYLAGRLPATVDQGSYVWSFWWVAHQIAHLGNPWSTRLMAAPVGMQLGFDTLMPLLGAVMAPVTAIFGPSATYNLLAIVIPGLLCYAAYRAARLWLASQLGAIAAGAFYGLATMLVWEDWYHLNIAAGALFLPVALEAAVRLKRRPRARQAVIVGLVIGASVLVNQESAFMAALVAAPVLAGWLIRDHTRANAALAGLAVAVALVVASPQLVAMIVQYSQGGVTVSPLEQARWDASFGTPLSALFAPSPRLADFGLTGLASLFSYQAPREGAPTYGVVLTALALLGLVVGWRRRGTRLLALAWLGAALLALGPVLTIGRRTFVPLPLHWHGVQVSALMPYTWFVRVPALDAFREADRLALLGLLPAALLAGGAVEWLWRHSRPLLVIALALAVLEAGYSGYSKIGTVPTAIPRLDGPIAADHSGSIVVDIRYGLRGGVALSGREISPDALVLATADGHPRAVSATSWVSARSVAAIRAHVFYGCLVNTEWGKPCDPAQVRLAHRDALRMRVGWAIVWKRTAFVYAYLRQVGFRYDYGVNGVNVYRLNSRPR
ncbi:MAG TPA: hypothetical protein VLL69_07880 [Streptosporangiaceae bacterium]|nr:hypothetical protein [Streptosporangiaceae bacterium]